MSRRIKSTKGFTLIELIIYIALVSVFVTTGILFVWDVIYGREKAFQQQIVDQSARIAMARISYEIRRAEDVDSVSSNQLILDNGGSTTTISLNSGAIEITTGGLGPYNLTSNQTNVTNLTFSDLGSVGADSKNILVELSMQQSAGTASGQLAAETTLQESVELNGQFKSSRALLYDLSALGLTTGTRIDGITIQDTSQQDIVIDKLSVSWQNTAGGENITEVQIGGGAVEWSGSQPTDSTLELNDFTLSPTDGVVNIDYIDFDSDMSGALIDLGFILFDGSTSNLRLSVESGDEVTPTPTPTPTPEITTCSDYCISIGYSGGICRANNGECNQNNETGENGGNQYCTGGASADTCCCQP